MIPEHIKALIVILITSVFGFFLIRRYLKKSLPFVDISVLARFWFVVVLLAFLSHDIYIFMMLTGGYLFFARPVNPSSRIALYVLLVLALPNVGFKIPGFGLINYLFELTYIRLLTIVLLLPLLFVKNAGNSFSRKFDKYIVGLVVLCSVLDFRDVSFTEGVRKSFYYILDILVPYYAVTRNIKSVEEIKELFVALLIPVFIMALMAIPEVFKSWHFYTALPDALGVVREGGINAYKYREGYLRAYGPYGAILLGYFIMLALGVMLYLNAKKQQGPSYGIYAILFIGLLLTFSRGPWMSTIVMMLVWGILSRKFGTFLRGGAVLGILALPLLMLTGIGRKILSMLPIFGEGESRDNIDYRERLFDIGVDVANQSPWFGDTNFLYHPSMQQLVQGEGIVDIVNTYLQYLLEYGYIGLSAFLCVFIIAIRWILSARKKSMDRDDSEILNLSNVLAAMLVATMVLIATVSSADHGVLSTVYWFLISLTVASVFIQTPKPAQKSLLSRGA